MEPWELILATLAFIGTLIAGLATEETAVLMIPEQRSVDRAARPASETKASSSQRRYDHGLPEH
jgi:hypothetical protein